MGKPLTSFTPGSFYVRKLIVFISAVAWFEFVFPSSAVKRISGPHLSPQTLNRLLILQIQIMLAFFFFYALKCWLVWFHAHAFTARAQPGPTTFSKRIFKRKNPPLNSDVTFRISVEITSSSDITKYTLLLRLCTEWALFSASFKLMFTEFIIFCISPSHRTFPK